MPPSDRASSIDTGNKVFAPSPADKHSCRTCTHREKCACEFVALVARSAKNWVAVDRFEGARAKMDAESREWLDRLAIQDLINRYSDAVTRADWQQCEAVFHVTRPGRAQLWVCGATVGRRSWKCSGRHQVTTC